MSFPESIKDVVIHQVALDAQKAIDDWLKGRPHDEPSFMNNLTRRLAQRRRCTIGTIQPMKVETTLYDLHRQGPSSKDQFGSDLAVTVTVPHKEFTKTVLLQLKRSERFSLSLKQEQLKNSQANPLTSARTFVLAVDENTGALRLKTAKDLLAQFHNPKQKSKKFDSSDWTDLNTFLHQWLSCHIGQPSVYNAPNSVENILSNFAVKDHPHNATPNQWIPAKIWLDVKFRLKRLING